MVQLALTLTLKLAVDDKGKLPQLAAIIISKDEHECLGVAPVFVLAHIAQFYPMHDVAFLELIRVNDSEAGLPHCDRQNVIDILRLAVEQGH